MEKFEIVGALSALAQESRLDVFQLLLEVGDDGLNVGEIGARLEMPNTTLLFHLEKLFEAGLLKRSKQGRATVYSANYGALVETVRALTTRCRCQSGEPCEIQIVER